MIVDSLGYFDNNNKKKLLKIFLKNKIAFRSYDQAVKFLNKNWISVIPTNMYGENDYFNLDKGHLIPSLIRKAYEASVSGDDFLVWGDGSPLRQFVYSDDAAELILWAIENWKQTNPFMLVSDQEFSIGSVANMIAVRLGIPENKIKYDISKPKGQFRKKAHSDCPDYNFTSLEKGISKTIDWFVENRLSIRE